MTGRFISKAVGGEHESPRPLAATLPRRLVAGYAARCYDEVDCWGRCQVLRRSRLLGSQLNCARKLAELDSHGLALRNSL
jgi:hypothetical protein